MFTELEYNRIFKDQEDALESCHQGDVCEDLSVCPDHHFDMDTLEVSERQSIMRKILWEVTNG